MWLDLDPIEQRYLLSAAADASVAIYDTLEPSSDSLYGYDMHKPVCIITKQTPGAHRFAISSIAWYPVDAGLFVTGSFDQTVIVWDANSLIPVTRFSLDSKVFSVSMSHATTSHTLVAVGCGNANVQLCDVASGGFTHTLAGSRADVLSVSWSLRNEWELAAGGKDGIVRLWDIRQAGAVGMLNQYSTTTNDTGTASSSLHQYGISHDGNVTCVAPSPDGLFWITSGTDDRLRLWDAATYRHMLVHYPNAFNRSNKARQLSSTGDGLLLFNPSGSVVQMYDIRGGDPVFDLKGGHFETVNCCLWNALSHELYTGSDDRSILVWEPPLQTNVCDDDEDNWSD